MKKPKPTPIYDSVALDRYMRDKYGFGTQYQYMLPEIVHKVCPDARNGSFVSLLKDHLCEECYPKLTDEQRSYIRKALQIFETNQYGEVQLNFWW